MSLSSTILIVDDEKNSREGLRDFLVSRNYDALAAESGAHALSFVKEEKPDLVLADLKMPEMDGLELLHRIKRLRPETIVIMLTAYGTVESAVQAMKAGAFYYLTKPVNFDELELILRKALREQRLEFENVSLREELLKEKHELGELIGESPGIKQVVETAKQIAHADSTILIQGESGTGKELVAHLIHKESLRCRHPFVTVHIAALTETLLASELFGHEKGAFTGAGERRIGRFERAHGGTLFLDEVSEIPEGMQTKLLRVLQNGEFERVGGAKTLYSDVRLVCATNRDLKALVSQGKFREDLYYRLNVILLDIPPLRHRRLDIPILARHFLDFFSKKNRKNIKGITSKAMMILEDYDWPGNVRELKNIVERMVVLSRSDVIDVADISLDLRKDAAKALESGKLENAKAGTLREMEKEMISRTLQDLNRNKSLAAKKLGVSRRTLYRKIEEYKLNE